MLFPPLKSALFKDITLKAARFADVVLSVENASGHGCFSRNSYRYMNHGTVFLLLSLTCLGLCFSCLFVCSFFIFWNGFTGQSHAGDITALTWAAKQLCITHHAQCLVPRPLQALLEFLLPWSLLSCVWSSSVASRLCCGRLQAAAGTVSALLSAHSLAWAPWLTAGVPRAHPFSGCCVLFLCWLLYMRALAAQRWSKDHEMKRQTAVFLLPGPPLPPRLPFPWESCCGTDSGLGLTLGKEGAESTTEKDQILQGFPEQTQSTQQENICLQGGLWRTWISFVCTSGQIPRAQQSQMLYSVLTLD